MLTKPIVSLDDVRAQLPVRSGVTTFDDRLTFFIEVATQQIQTMTRRAFTRQEHTQLFRTIYTTNMSYDFANPANEAGVFYRSRSVRYALQGVPVDTDEDFKVYYDTTRAFTEDTLVDPSDYVVDAQNGILTLTLPMVESPQALKVVYTAGYEVDTDTNTLREAAPYELRLACIAQVIYMWSKMSADNLGMVSDKNQARGAQNNDARKFITAGGLTPEAASLVSSYRAPLLGLG